MRILTNNNSNNTNIDGARAEFFNSSNRDGIVKGAFNEGRFFASSSNVITLDTCELRISGHRIVIDEPLVYTFNTLPSENIRYIYVAQIVVNESSAVSFSTILKTLSDSELIKDNLFKYENGNGTYQVEIGRFTQQIDGTITDIVRTIDLITGGSGISDSGTINIGNIVTNTLDPEFEAEVDIEQRYNPIDEKTYTDFTFMLPKGATGATGATNTLSIGTVSSGQTASATITGTAPNQTLNLVLPKGDKGDEGDKGDKGDVGATFSFNATTGVLTITTPE